MLCSAMQMAYAAASLTLNNRQRYRNFFRTMPVYTNMGVAVAKLAETFNWTQLAVITQSNGLFVPVQFIASVLIHNLCHAGQPCSIGAQQFTRGCKKKRLETS